MGVSAGAAEVVTKLHAAKQSLGDIRPLCEKGLLKPTELRLALSRASSAFDGLPETSELWRRKDKLRGNSWVRDVGAYVSPNEVSRLDEWEKLIDAAIAELAPQSAEDHVLASIFEKFVTDADHFNHIEFEIAQTKLGRIHALDSLLAKGAVFYEDGKVKFGPRGYFQCASWGVDAPTVGKLAPILLEFYENGPDSIHPIEVFIMRAKSSGFALFSPTMAQRFIQIFRWLGLIGGHQLDATTKRITGFSVSPNILRFTTVEAQVAKYFPAPSAVLEPGGVSAATPSPSSGDGIPNYILRDSLGSGGFGEVFRAKPLSGEGADVAIKLISPSSFADDADQDRFLREASALSKLKHRAIVNYISCGFTKDSRKLPYIVMELIEGKRLSDPALLFDTDEKVAAIAETLEALEFSHREKVVHRDVRPSNIMVRSSDRQAILVDFGQAYVFDGLDQHSMTEKMVGTLGYIPLEVQANPKLRSPQHDIYSCGISLYELIAGVRPVPPNPRSLSHVSPDLVSLDSIIKQALSPAEQRFQTAGEFAHALRGWLSRRATATTLQSSARFPKLKEKLLARRSEQENKQAEAQRRADVIREQVLAHHNMIVGLAERVANEAHHALLDVDTRYSLKKSKELGFVEEPGGPHGSIPLIGITEPNGLKYVAIGLAKTSIVQEKTRESPNKKQLTALAITGITWLPTCWIVFTEASTVKSRNLQGHILAGVRPSSDSSSPKVVLVRGRMFSESGSELPPAEISDSQDIYDYLAYLLEATLS